MKGYSGVATFARTGITINADISLGESRFDDEGKIKKNKKNKKEEEKKNKMKNKKGRKEEYKVKWNVLT